MNKSGTPENLRARHPGNTSAVKSGIYSPRIREEKTREVLLWLEKRPVNDVLEDVTVLEFAGLVGLYRQLFADVETHGAVDSRGRVRRSAELMLSTSRRIESLIGRIPDSTPGVENSGEKAARSDGAPSLEQERYDALTSLAFDRRSPCSTQIDALKDLYEAQPPEPQVPDNESPDHSLPEFQDGLAILLFEISAYCSGERPISSRGISRAARWRCLEELHAIGTGMRARARPADRRRALKLLRDLELSERARADTTKTHDPSEWDMSEIRVIAAEFEANGFGSRFDLVEQDGLRFAVLRSGSGQEIHRFPVADDPHVATDTP